MFPAVMCNGKCVLGTSFQRKGDRVLSVATQTVSLLSEQVISNKLLKLTLSQDIQEIFKPGNQMYYKA